MPPPVEHDEDGVAEPFAKRSATGGLGLFTTGKPKPIEYKRDAGRAAGGFLSAEEADALWAAQTRPATSATARELCAQYVMEVGLDTQWYRDEVRRSLSLSL